MSRMSPASADSSAELSAVFDEIEKSRGWVSNAMKSFAHAPEGLRRFAHLGDYGRYHTDLSEMQRELVIVSIGRAVPYAAAHHAALARQAGVPSDAVDEILAGRVPSTLSESDQAVVRYTLEFGSPESVSDATFAAVRKFFSERAVTDLTLLAAYYLALGTSLNALKLDLEPPEVREIEMRWQAAKTAA